MRAILHILTSKADTTAADTIGAQGEMPECHVDVVDIRPGEPNYDELLQKIFQADSVQVW